MEESAIGGGYAGNSAMDQGLMKMPHQPTLKQRMDGAVKQAEERLAQVKEALELLDRNPDLEKLLNIMQRGWF